jgi:hypothetical protein
MAEPAPTPNETDEIIDAARALTTLFAEDPSAVDHIRTIIDLELSARVHDDTYGSIGRRLDEYLTEAVASFLLNTLTVVDLEPALADVGVAEAVPDAAVLVRRLSFLRALYKERLQAAQMAWRENPDDWSAVTREVTFDQLNKMWRYALFIDKFNEERVTLRGTASSLVNLMYQIVKLIQQFPDPSAVAPERLAELQKELEGFERWRAGLPPLQEDVAAVPEPEPGVAEAAVAEVGTPTAGAPG